MCIEIEKYKANIEINKNRETVQRFVLAAVNRILKKVAVTMRV